LRLTGFRTYGELLRETTPPERELLIKSVEAYHRERERGMPD